MNIIQLLKEPFPSKVDYKTYVFEMLGVALFISLFLYLIRPFGIANWEGSLALHCIGFGVVTLAISLLFDSFLYYALGIRKDLPAWTFGKWLLSAACMLTLLGFANYSYVHYLVYQSFQTWRIQGAFQMVYYTLLLGIFPLIFGGMMQQIRAQKANDIEATQVQQKLDPTFPQSPSATFPQSPNFRTSHILSLSSQNKKEQLALSPDQILYLEAQQNYVEVCYLEEVDDKQVIQKKLLRNTLSQFEKQLVDTNIIRCHRSFLVNITHIENVTGNAQGLKLTLQYLPDLIIPVSRKYIATLKATL